MSAEPLQARQFLVKGCVYCPWGRNRGGVPVCEADMYLFESEEGKARPFGGQRFPEPAPDWCPLRERPLILGVMEQVGASIVIDDGGWDERD